MQCCPDSNPTSSWPTRQITLMLKVFIYLLSFVNVSISISWIFPQFLQQMLYPVKTYVDKVQLQMDCLLSSLFSEVVQQITNYCKHYFQLYHHISDLLYIRNFNFSNFDFFCKFAAFLASNKYWDSMRVLGT